MFASLIVRYITFLLIRYTQYKLYNSVNVFKAGWKTFLLNGVCCLMYKRHSSFISQGTAKCKHVTIYAYIKRTCQGPQQTEWVRSQAEHVSSSMAMQWTLNFLEDFQWDSSCFGIVHCSCYRTTLSQWPSMCVWWASLEISAEHMDPAGQLQWWRVVELDPMRLRRMHGGGWVKLVAHSS